MTSTKASGLSPQIDSTTVWVNRITQKNQSAFSNQSCLWTVRKELYTSLKELVKCRRYHILSNVWLKQPTSKKLLYRILIVLMATLLTDAWSCIIATTHSPPIPSSMDIDVINWWATSLTLSQ